MTADSSYWIYVIHLPIVIFVQTLLIPWEVSLWIKLAIVVGVTWLFSFASYLVVVRYMPVGWILHGPASISLKPILSRALAYASGCGASLWVRAAEVVFWARHLVGRDGLSV